MPNQYQGRRMTSAAARPRSNYSYTSAPRPSSRAVSSRSRFGNRKPLLVVLALLLGIGLFITISWFRGYYGSVIINGVMVEGVDVSGMNRDQAKLAVETVINPLITNARISITNGDQEWALGGDELQIQSDLENVLDQVMALGHTGSLSERRTQAASYKAVPTNFDVQITYSQQVIDDLLTQIGQEMNLDAHDSVITFDPTAEDAEDMFTFAEGEWGQRVSMETMETQLMEDFADDYIGHVELVVEQVSPTVTREQFEKSTQQIAYFGTDIGGSMNSPRTENIKLAMSAVNGTILMPGETFSFNETVGERTAARGYQEAPVIARDKGLEDAMGGGVCQASTTIYNAALLAGCTIEERSKHSFPSSYVKLGFDAMVNWPNHDLKFKNDTDGPIYIKALVEEDEDGIHARVWIYGTPNEEGITYDRKYVVVEREPAPEPVVKPDTEGKYADSITYDDEEYVYSISREGIKVQTYRLWIKDGEVIKEEELFLDYYKPIAGIIYTGATSASKRPSSVTPAPPKEDDGTGELDPTAKATKTPVPTDED